MSSQHRDVAEIALAEVEGEVALHHDEEALVGRLVEAELLLEALDELRIEALRAAIFRGDDVGGALPELRLAAVLDSVSLPPPPMREAMVEVAAGQLRDDALDGSAGRELNDDEADQHDAEQRRYDQQQALEEIGGHRGLGSVLFQLRSFVGVVPPRVDDALVELRLYVRARELVPEGDIVLGLIPLRHPVMPGAQHAVEGAAPPSPARRVIWLLPPWR